MDERMADMAIEAAKNAIFEQHVTKIVEQDGCSRSDAKFRAWLEGAEGFTKRKTPSPVE